MARRVVRDVLLLRSQRGGYAAVFEREERGDEDQRTNREQDQILEKTNASKIQVFIAFFTIFPKLNARRRHKGTGSRPRAEKAAPSPQFGKILHSTPYHHDIIA